MLDLNRVHSVVDKPSLHTLSEWYIVIVYSVKKVFNVQYQRTPVYDILSLYTVKVPVFNVQYHGTPVYDILSLYTVKVPVFNVQCQGTPVYDILSLYTVKVPVLNVQH